MKKKAGELWERKITDMVRHVQTKIITNCEEISFLFASPRNFDDETRVKSLKKLKN